MPPDNDDGREAHRNGNHVQGAVYGMIMRAVVVRVETHSSTPRVRESKPGRLYPVAALGASLSDTRSWQDEFFKDFVRKQSSALGQPDYLVVAAQQSGLFEFRNRF